MSKSAADPETGTKRHLTGCQTRLVGACTYTPQITSRWSTEGCDSQDTEVLKTKTYISVMVKCKSYPARGGKTLGRSAQCTPDRTREGAKGGNSASCLDVGCRTLHRSATSICLPTLVWYSQLLSFDRSTDTERKKSPESCSKSSLKAPSRVSQKRALLVTMLAGCLCFYCTSGSAIESRHGSGHGLTDSQLI